MEIYLEDQPIDVARLKAAIRQATAPVDDEPPGRIDGRQPGALDVHAARLAGGRVDDDGLPDDVPGAGRGRRRSADHDLRSGP